MVNYLIKTWNALNKLINNDANEDNKQNLIDFTLFEAEMINRGIVKNLK